MSQTMFTSSSGMKSAVDDCDYTSPNCNFAGGTEYPIATFDVMAGLITQPAQISVAPRIHH